MKKKILKPFHTIIYVCLLIFFSTMIIAAPPELQVVGKNLQTVSGGCVVRLVGVNVDGLEWSPAGYGPPSGNAGNIGQSITGAVNNWHANFVRVPISQDFWFGHTNSHGTANQANYRAFVDDAVTTASGLNCYVEIDLHWSGNGNWGSSDGQLDMPDDNSTAFWTDVATHYANNPAVFFNLYNEPKDDSWSTWKNGGTSLSGFHTPGFQALVKTVRDTGAKNIIVIGGLGWAWDMTGIAANSITDTNTAGNMSGNGIMYEAHIYDNKGGSTEAQKIALWNANVTVAVNAGFCVDIGEFGPVTNGDQDASGCTPFESDLISWINGNNPAGYVYNAMAWDFNTVAGPVLLKDWAFTSTDCHGAQVKSWLEAITPVICAAASPTVTPTFTRTVTSTATRTTTQSFTRTASPTYSRTASLTYTATATQTSTGTQTFTATSTFTGTATFTATVTSTASITPTWTIQLYSPTITETNTVFISPTFTETLSPTETVTFTKTFTSSFTATYTQTETVTVSRTITLTVTQTASVTPYHSPTFTSTGTPPTETVTQTITQTNTIPYTSTNTVTLTVTSPVTPPDTFTLTRTPSSTFTYTAAVTKTGTPTVTGTFTGTATATLTATRTLVFTSTVTRTLTYVSTFIPTAEATQTFTVLPTATIAWGDKFEIPVTLIYPNPCNSGYADLKMKIDITQPASEMKIRIYTVGFRRIMETEIGAQNSKEFFVTIPKEKILYLAAGTYYMVATGKSVSGTDAVSKPKILIILK